VDTPHTHSSVMLSVAPDFISRRHPQVGGALLDLRDRGAPRRRHPARPHVAE
jgi:hypothetical protein